MKKIRIISLVSLCLMAITCLAKGDPMKIAILGDSYSTYEGYLTPDTNAIWYYKPDNKLLHKQNDVRKPEETWWWQVIENMGGKLETNNSYSGATICYTGYRNGREKASAQVPLAGLEQHADYSDRAFITRSNKLGNPDVILICGATNDSWCGAPIGEYTYGNWTTEELYYFRPAMAKLLYDVRLNYPTARILFILNSELKPVINESIHAICRHYDVPCLDLQDIEKQGGHPSVKGMKAIADQVTAKLRQIIKK